MDHLVAVSPRIRRIATIAIWLSSLFAGLLIFFVVFGLGSALVDPSWAAREVLLGQMEWHVDLPTDMTVISVFPAMAIWVLTDVVGLVLLLSVRALFQGVKAGQMFSNATAQRIQRIGWLLILIVPVAMVANGITSGFLSHWADPGSFGVEINIDDTDCYALVIGLVILALGHIMVQAVEISEDNQAII